MLLLEAGGRDFNPLIHIPIGLGKLHEYKMHDWGYQSEPDPNLNGRRVEEMRGKVLGGSSSINVMAFTRGDPADYDRWAQKGALGWSYADVLPYFKRVESWQDGESEYRGDAGNIGVQWAKTKDPMFTAWLESARMAGLPVTDDYNSSSGEGFGRSQYSIRDGKRCSAAVGYLHPAMKRKNLDGRGAGPCRARHDAGQPRHRRRYEKGGQALHANAEREVILCGGAFNSPQVLMLSGIGPADHLRSVGIEPVIDLPVGKNLQDHLAVLIMFARTEPQRIPRQHAARQDGAQHDARLDVRHRPGDRGAGRPARLHQDAARACRCPTSSSCSAARRPPPRCGSRAGRSPMRTATASGRACCIPTAAARCCCARPIRATR